MEDANNITERQALSAGQNWKDACYLLDGAVQTWLSGFCAFVPGFPILKHIDGMTDAHGCFLFYLLGSLSQMQNWLRAMRIMQKRE
jgi:hypothetical protein